jgi:hypothetical protein
MSSYFNLVKPILKDVLFSHPKNIIKHFKPDFSYKNLSKLLKGFFMNIKLSVIVYTFVYFLDNSNYWHKHYNPGRSLGLFLFMALSLVITGTGKAHTLTSLCIYHLFNSEKNKFKRFENILTDSFLTALIGHGGLGGRYG